MVETADALLAMIAMSEYNNETDKSPESVECSCLLTILLT
jgi:hypothetical protein